MATSVRDLLIRLSTQVDNLDTRTPFAPSPAALEHGWQKLSRAAQLVVAVAPIEARVVADRRLELILKTLPVGPGPVRSVGSAEALHDLAATLGTIADLLTLRPLVSQSTLDTTGRVIAASLQATLGAAAGWTLHTTGPTGPPRTLEPQLRRLAGYGGGPLPAPPLAAAAWRLTSTTDPGLDGAVTCWAQAAHHVIADPRTVSQLGLQLAAAGIALLCRTAAATRTHEPGGIPVGHSCTSAAVRAAEAWEQAAVWPAHLHLGGRSTELRDASRELRQTIQTTLSGVGDGKPAGELSTPDQLEVAHSALQAAWQVGCTATDTLRELSYGPSRVWTRTPRVIRHLPSAEQLLEAAGKDWLPDPAGVHSAKPLLHAAVEAQGALTLATPRYLSSAPPTIWPQAVADADADAEPAPVWEITTAPDRHRRPDEDQVHLATPANNRPVAR